MLVQKAAQQIGRGAGQPRRGEPLRASDFLVRRDTDDDEWKLSALEINLRMGGTTHPYLALQFLTGGALDPHPGLFLSPSGHAEVLPRDRQPEVRAATAACCPRT